MALECVCFPLVDPRLANNVPRTNQMAQKNCCEDRKVKADLDLCKIVKRTRDDEQTKHNEYECHLKGERRQNLINKIKMYLDGYDDRPVMRSAGKKDEHSAKGQTGFGPMIKYPGYVDYNHPYFSDPFNKMPTLAMTVGQRRGENPCPPISVRNYDASHGGGEAAFYGEDATAGRSTGSGAQAENGSRGGCHCAQRRSEDAKCPAAMPPQPQPRQRQNAQQWASRSEMIGPEGVGVKPGATGAQGPAMVCICRTIH